MPSNRSGTTVGWVLALLDLDGTLTDPYDGITRSVTYALNGLGLPRLEERQLRSFIGPPLQDQFAALGLNEGDVVRAVELYRERFRDHGLYENRVYEGVPEALAALAAVPLRLAVATSKPTPFAQRIVKDTSPRERGDRSVGDRSAGQIGSLAAGPRYGRSFAQPRSVGTATR